MRKEDRSGGDIANGVGGVVLRVKDPPSSPTLGVTVTK